jgi:predicted thioesterase
MQIREGQTLTREFEVQDRHTAAHIGSGTVKVLATPVMIAFIEITALELMGQSLDEGYTSVGTRLDIRHLAPSPLGRTVQVNTTVEQVDGNKVILQAEVWDGGTLVGSGSHERFVIEVQRFTERIKKLSEAQD